MIRYVGGGHWSVGNKYQPAAKIWQTFPRPVSCVINVASVAWFSVSDGRQVYMYNVVFNNIAVILGGTLYRW